METDNQIVRQLFGTVQELERMMSGLCRNDLLLIESFHGEGVSLCSSKRLLSSESAGCRRVIPPTT